MIKYIAEIAGKDSVAAIHKFMAKGMVDKLIPTIVYTGTEYGNNTTYFESINYLIQCGQEYDIQFDEPIQLHDEQLWNFLCIKYQHQFNIKYGFYTPCIMCHLFTHLLRIPILLKTNSIGIITGERFSHKGTLKANQHPITIECFNKLFNKYNISLIQPVADISDTKIIDQEIEDYTGFSNFNDIKCILSGNLNIFSNFDNNMLQQLQRYLNEVIFPVGKYVLDCFFESEPVQYDVLGNIIERGLQ